MRSIDVVRAWKDAAYRESLEAEQRSALPVNPAGWVELSDDELKAASGLAGIIVTTFKTCTEYTFHRFHCC